MMRAKVARHALPALLAAATLFWFVLFSPWTAGAVNFWLGMVAAGGLLAGSALALDGRRLCVAPRPRQIAAGLLAAILLYALFWIGGTLGRAMLPFAGGEIEAVYARRAAAPLGWIALALLVWIGPAEEIFWRGLVQHRLAARLGDRRGLLLASSLYAAVHLWAGNLMLVAAALLCGLFWGMIYMRCKSLWPPIISHAVWDVLVFVLLPLG